MWVHGFIRKSYCFPLLIVIDTVPPATAMMLVIMILVLVLAWSNKPTMIGCPYQEYPQSNYPNEKTEP